MVETSAASRLRLLFVGSLPRWGGRGRWLVQAASGLAARGHDVQVITTPGSKLLARAAEAGLPTHIVPNFSWSAPRALLRLRRLLGALQPEAVFVQRAGEARLLSWCAWPAAPPPLFQRLGPAELEASPRLFRRRRVERFLVSSRHGRRWLQQHAGMDADALRVLPDGVPLGAPEPPPDRDALRRRLKLPRKTQLVLHVGHLEARKGQETSLRALATLRVWRPGALPTLAFIGTGTDEARLHDLCHELGLKEHVLWVGFRTNVASYMEAADLLILPSRRAGIPWTLLEGMAQGVPVIAAAVDGIDELIESGRNGLLVPPDDPTALADAMTKVLDDPALAAHLAQHGLATVLEGWNQEAMLDDLESLVRSHHLRVQRTGAALFVDRDDTLMRNVPYNSDPEQVELFPGAARALRWVRDAGIPIVVVSNQSGIAQGLHGAAEVVAVNKRMRELLRAEGADVDAVYFCPHHPEHGSPCDCRKPEPGLLLQAARDLHMELRKSLMVGNARRDLEAGRRAGCAAVGLVQEGAGTDLSGEEPAYTSWTALVRDFLASVRAGSTLVAPALASVPHPRSDTAAAPGPRAAAKSDADADRQTPADAEPPATPSRPGPTRSE